MMLDINKIELNGEVRLPLMQAYVLMLVEHKIPPVIKVFRQDNAQFPFKIYDGCHRLAAARHCGRKKIKAQLVDLQEILK
jgi:hypothetical protein